jgi:hypothetical protein
MLGDTKSLKRNQEEREGTRIAPLKLPRYLIRSISCVSDFRPAPERQLGFGPNLSARTANRQKTPNRMQLRS